MFMEKKKNHKILVLQVSRTEPEFLNFLGAQESIKELIPPGCVAWRAGTTTLFPTRFLAPIDCLQIPAQISPNLYKAFYKSTCVTSQGFLSYCWYTV